MIVHYSEKAKNDVWSYYESPPNGVQHNYLRRRGDNFSRISQTLRQLDRCLDQTYKKNGGNFIRIDNVATVEYAIENNGNEVVVRNIYFSNNQPQSQNTNQQLNTTNQQQNTQQQNNQQQQIQYKRVSKESFGLTRVQSNNKLFNFVDKNGKFFYPHGWFKQAEDFKQWNKVVAARVLTGNQWYFLSLNNGMLYPIAGKTESKVIKKMLIEEVLQEVIEVIEVLLERNKRYASKKNSPSLLNEQRLLEEKCDNFKLRRILNRL